MLTGPVYPTVTINGTEVPVVIPPELENPTDPEPGSGRPKIKAVGIDALLAFQPFVDWCKNLDPRFNVRAIHIQSVDWFGPRIGFVKLNVDIVDPDGKFVPGIAFLRGGSVVILVVLTHQGESHTVIVKQARAPVGRFELPEIAAGMLDGSGHFTGKAAAEMKEELGLEIDAGKLVDLTELVYGDEFPGIYATPGGSDEFFRVMLYQQEVDDLSVFQDRQTGLAAEGESISTEVIPMCDLCQRCPDAKTLAAMMLFTFMLANNPLKAAGEI